MVEVSWRLRLDSGWRNSVTSGLESGLQNFAESLKSQAVQNAPVLTGALRQSAKVTATSRYERVVSFGNTNVKYAVRRHYENYKNPQTLYYLERAGETAAARYSQYFERTS